MRNEPIRETPEGILVDVLVVPNASRARVVGLHGDRIKVRVSRPPEKNRANTAVEALLKEVTGARRVSVVSGRTARHKTVLLVGVDAEAVRRHLTAM